MAQIPTMVWERLFRIIETVSRITDMLQLDNETPFILPHTSTFFPINYLSVSTFSENTCLVIQEFLSDY